MPYDPLPPVAVADDNASPEPLAFAVLLALASPPEASKAFVPSVPEPPVAEAEAVALPFPELPVAVAVAVPPLPPFR